MTYDPLYSIDFPLSLSSTDRYDNCTLYDRLFFLSSPFDKWVKRFSYIYLYVCGVLAMIIFIWTCQMEFSSFSSFSHTPARVLDTRVCRMRRFLTLFFLLSLSLMPRFRKQTSIFLPHSLTHSLRCLLTAFRYRQEANIERKLNEKWGN